MKHSTEASNNDIKKEINKKIKLDDNNQHSTINLNKNNIDNIYKLLINDDYYSISQNLNNLIKSYHKSLMQNIGKMNKSLLNEINDKNANDNDNKMKEIDNKNLSSSILRESNEKNEPKIYDSLITILNKIESIHNNYYLNSKRILLKMNKNYNKRKKKLKKYKIIEKDKYSFTFGLISKMNNENGDINLKIKTQEYNNNSNQVIINNIQNIINTIDNKSNDIISNNINQNELSSLFKENQLLKQKLTNITATNQKSEITNYINYIENKIKNDDHNTNNNIFKIENCEKIEIKKLDNKDIAIYYQNINEINFEFMHHKIINNGKNIKFNKIISFNLICNENKEKENEEINNLTLINKELFDNNIKLKEKIDKLSSELKKTKEEKTNIIFKNGLTEKKIIKLNSDNDKYKKSLEQKDIEIEELKEKIEENKLKINDLENLKNTLQNKIFNCTSKINDLSSNYENLEKEKETEINDYKDYLNEKEDIIEELKLKNKQLLEKISLLEQNSKSYSNENQDLKLEINNIKKNYFTFEFKIKQNEQTISYLNKQNENLIKENNELVEQIKSLNKEIKEQKKIIKEFNIKLKYNDNEEDIKEVKEVVICKDKEINYLKKIVNLNKEEISKKENEIQLLNSDLTKANADIEKLNKDIEILEGENKEAIQSFNDLNKKNKEINKELNHLKRYYEPLEEKLSKKEQELNISSKNYNFLQKTNKKLIQENENYKAQIEKLKKDMESNKTNRNSNYEIIKENSQLKKDIKEMDDEIEDLNKKIEDQSEKIIYYKSSLINEQNKNIELEKKYQENSKKLEDLQKTKNENKFSKIDFSSKADYNTYTSSITSTNNSEIDMKDITPSKYSIIKCVEINELKWYLFRKKNTFYDNKNYNKRYSQRTSYSNKTFYYSRYEKMKSNCNETNTKENYDNYIWKPMINQKDFNEFGTLPQGESVDDKNKINETEKEIKELKDKLSKKEDDYNRININYAKLLKKTKNPVNNQEKLMETINKLKIENKKLNNSLIKCKSEKNIIGISFIEDDLEGSFFIDNFCFDNILDEINKTDNKFMAMNNTLQKNAKPFHEKKVEDIKLENNNKENKDDS